MLIAIYVIALAVTAASSILIVATIVAFRLETVTLRLEIVLSNKVTIYKLLNSLNVTKLAKIVNKYLKI